MSDTIVTTYTWSARGQMLAEWTQGYPVRTFTYDGAGQMVEATVFTLTTRFRYNGLGARVAVEVVGPGTTTYTLDYAAGNRILAETTDTGSTMYLYGRDCLGEMRDDDWLYYLSDAERLVRQGVDEQGQVVSNWLFDPDGTVLEGPEGPVSHLVCGGVYDWSTGLIHKDGRYFDPMLGIWLALMPLVVVQSWRGRKKKRRGFPWLPLGLLAVFLGTMLTGCAEEGPSSTPTVCLPAGTVIPTPWAKETPTPTPRAWYAPIPNPTPGVEYTDPYAPVHPYDGQAVPPPPIPDFEVAMEIIVAKESLEHWQLKPGRVFVTVKGAVDFYGSNYTVREGTFGLNTSPAELQEHYGISYFGRKDDAYVEDVIVLIPYRTAPVQPSSGLIAYGLPSNVNQYYIVPISEFQGQSYLFIF